MGCSKTALFCFALGITRRPLLKCVAAGIPTLHMAQTLATAISR